MEKKLSISKQFLRVIRLFPKKHLLMLGITMTIGLAVISVVNAILIQNIIDSAIMKDRDKFFINLYFLIGIVVLQLLFVFYKTKTLGYYTEQGMASLREDIGKKLSIVSFEDLSKSHSGDYVSRATNDMAKVKDFTTGSLPFLIGTPIAAVGAIVYFLILNWQLTVLSLSLVPILLIVSSLLTKPMASMGKKQQEKLADVNGIETDFIKGIEVAKAYNLESVIEEKLDQNVDLAVYYEKKLAKRSAMLDSISQAISLLPFFVTFIVGGYYVSKGELTVGGLLAFIMLLNRVTFPIAYLPYVIGESRRELGSVERVMELLDKREERKNGYHFDLVLEDPFIEFRDVSFTYPSQSEPLFEQLNFKINYNDSIAFVGPSGSGKSTIIKLLLGYYENYQGEIIIGGHELREWNLSHLRQQMALVSQDTFLFPEKITENIRYGKLEAREEEIIVSAKKANAHQFIVNFENGYQSEVGQLGNTLSGGQRQRITISRAILKNAPIFLLDEATSALDTESETLIQASLDEFMKDKTSIVIAHRLSTIKTVNLIYVLSNGKIVEQGSHDDLIDKNGVYSQLYKKQLQKNEGGLRDEEEK